MLIKKFRKAQTIFILFIILWNSLGCERETKYLERTKPQVILSASDMRLLAPSVHLSGDTVYVLATDLVRESGESLIIDAGTLIKVNDLLSIIINEGATIEAKGTASEPIVFTSAAEKGAAGVVSGALNTTDHYWYGIRIYGNALNTPPSSSGVLNFVRVEFGGGNGWPGLFLQNISSETKLENIQVSYSYTGPSFEFLGGDVYASHLVSYASAGTDFLMHGGFTGKTQFLLAYRHSFFPASIGFFTAPLGGLVLADNNTFPTISNLTVLGPGLQSNLAMQYTSTYGPRAGFIVWAGARFHIRNTVLLGFPLGGFYLNDAASGLSLQSGESDFTSSMVHSNDNNRSFYLPENVFPPYTSTDFKDFMLQTQFQNEIVPKIDDFLIADPFNYDQDPNPLPKQTSPMLSGSNFDPPFDDPFFQQVSHRGAIGVDNWLTGWTNFKPLQTNYNN